MDNRMFNWNMMVEHIENEDITVILSSRCWYAYGNGKTFQEAFDMAHARTLHAYPVEPDYFSGRCKISQEDVNGMHSM